MFKKQIVYILNITLTVSGLKMLHKNLNMLKNNLNFEKVNRALKR